MEQSMIDEILKLQWPWIKQAAILMGPPIALITMFMSFIRMSLKEVFEFKWDIVEGSPKDHMRGIILWLMPLFISIAYLITASGTSLTGMKKLQFKEYFIGSIILWIASTLFYRFVWKPWASPKLRSFFTYTIPILKKPETTPVP